MNSHLITAHSVVHERMQWASIPHQKAKLQNSVFHAEAVDTVCVTVQKSLEQRGLLLQQMRKKRDARGHGVGYILF